MSLGDLNKKVNIAGQSTYNNASSRMRTEKEAHEKQLQMREMDRVKQEISHRRIEHQRIVGELARVKRELIRLKTGRRDGHTIDLIRNTESQIRTLENEAHSIEQDIRIKTLDVGRHGGVSF
jgi:hypothetical protein